ARSGRPVSVARLRPAPLGHTSTLLAAFLCLGLATANLARVESAVVPAAALLAGMFGASRKPRRVGLLAVALALAGWWWGSARLDALDYSSLTGRLETAGRARAIVTGPARRGKYDVRAPGVVTRFAGQALHESVLLKLPLGRAPPQGAILDALVRVTAPRGPKNGFDERTWLRRHGVHVVLLVDGWQIVGRRSGLGGVADALRRRLKSSVALGLTGYRAAVLEGVVLGEDSGLSDELRRRFRASGLYHLLAVSGQNVALVAGSALLLVWLVGMPRRFGQLAALAAICCYVLAVGAPRSVLRAGLATAPIAWLQFHSVQLLTVPANALAAPAVAPLLGLALAAAAVAPFSTNAAAALAWLNGWCAAYLVAVARLVGGLPIAQVKST